MPRATRAKEGTTPKKGRKANPEGTALSAEPVINAAEMPLEVQPSPAAAPQKRSRKTSPENGNGSHAEPVTFLAEASSDASPAGNIEERIRRRAYELYLQRGGTAGSPEQDWLQAQAEVCGQQTV